MKKILEMLKDNPNRKARFKTVAVLYLPREKRYFTAGGTVEGEILEAPEKKEGSGFGYDPVFKPVGFNKSFSMLGKEVKNKISHRSKALNKMKEIIEENFWGGNKMIEIKVNGKRLPANKYVYEVFKSVIFALLNTLKNVQEIDSVEITIKKDKEKEIS
jgi:XTP/dITP diphosphohydrolase